jgi:hypothetical protein
MTAEQDILNANYYDFVREYEAICLRTGYYIDVTKSNELGIFYVSINDDDFTAQIKEFRGG